jgi:hypothetical protein
LDRTFFALSDPTRRSILERLAHGPATIGELAEPFGLTLNGLKKHAPCAACGKPRGRFPPSRLKRLWPKQSRRPATARAL